MADDDDLLSQFLNETSTKRGGKSKKKSSMSFLDDLDEDDGFGPSSTSKSSFFKKKTDPFASIPEKQEIEHAEKPPLKQRSPRDSSADKINTKKEDDFVSSMNSTKSERRVSFNKNANKTKVIHDSDEDDVKEDIPTPEYEVVEDHKKLAKEREEERQTNVLETVSLNNQAFIDGKKKREEELRRADLEKQKELAKETAEKKRVAEGRKSKKEDDSSPPPPKPRTRKPHASLRTGSPTGSVCEEIDEVPNELGEEISQPAGKPHIFYSAKADNNELIDVFNKVQNLPEDSKVTKFDATTGKSITSTPGQPSNKQSSSHANRLSRPASASAIGRPSSARTRPSSGSSKANFDLREHKMKNSTKYGDIEPKIRSRRPGSACSNLDETGHTDWSSMSFQNTIEMRNTVYDDWWRRKNAEFAEKKMTQKQQQEAFERFKAEEAERKRQESLATFLQWSKTKDLTVKEQMREIRKKQQEAERKKAEEEKEKRTISQKAFAQWKSTKDVVLTEEEKKKRRAERKVAREKEEQKKEKKKDANGAFKAWKEKKDVKLKMTFKEILDQKRKEQEAKVSKEMEKVKRAESAYESWMARKEKTFDELALNEALRADRGCTYDNIHPAPFRPTGRGQPVKY